MNIESLIMNQNGTMTGADRKLADVLLALGREAAFMSSHDIARRAGTHPASAVRFARRLGFSGYPDLQAALKAETLAEPNAADRMRSRIVSLANGGLIAGLAATEMEGMLALADTIKDADLERLAQKLIAARRICIYGVGHGAIAADYLTMRLQRSGYLASSLHSMDWHAVDALSEWGEGDEIVIIVLRKFNAGHVALIAHARSIGASVTVIGDLAAAEPLPSGVETMVVRRGADGVQSVLVPAALINALIIQIGHLDAGRSFKALEAREVLRKTLLKQA